MSITQLNSNWRIDADITPEVMAGQNAYAVIEPLLWNDWQTQLQPPLESVEFVSLLAGTRLAHIKTGPVLVALGTSDAALQTCVSAMSQAPCGCLMWSGASLTISQLAALLRQRLVLKQDQGEALFRFYEPRTLLPLMAALSDEQRQQMLPLLSGLRWYDKTWLSVTLANPAEPTALIPPWTLSQQQLSTMQSIAQQW